jgi:hypothetical protein
MTRDEWLSQFADEPKKLRPHVGDRFALTLALLRYDQQEHPRVAAREYHQQQLRNARGRYETVVVTPYAVPGETGVQRMQANRARGVRICFLTNSLGFDRRAGRALRLLPISQANARGRCGALRTRSHAFRAACHR